MNEPKAGVPPAPEGPGTDAENPTTARVNSVTSAEEALKTGGPALGKRLKIRSMITMAGEVLPFFWPMRNFIHHNPLNGLEHLPFEEAVAEATRLFHARGYLRRSEYQRLMARGSIDQAVLRALVTGFVQDWLAELGARDNPALAGLLERCLMALLTQTDQPAPGVEIPCAEEVLAAMNRHLDKPKRGTTEP